MRLDRAVAARFPHISRRQARELIAARRVLVNERAVAIASRDVRDADRVAVIENEPALDVLKTTDDFVAVNKPAGMPTQPTRDRKERSLEELLRAKFKSIYLVHRLDTGTSGVVVFARTSKAAARLSRLFASREMQRTYLARIEPPLRERVVIETPIGGKDAYTEAEPYSDPSASLRAGPSASLRAGPSASLRAGLALVRIRTGRTHQIRVHLASIGHSVRALHAWRLEHEAIGSIEAPPPDDLV